MKLCYNEKSRLWYLDSLDQCTVTVRQWRRRTSGGKLERILRSFDGMFSQLLWCLFCASLHELCTSSQLSHVPSFESQHLTSPERVLGIKDWLYGDHSFNQPPRQCSLADRPASVTWKKAFTWLCFNGLVLQTSCSEETVKSTQLPELGHRAPALPSKARRNLLSSRPCPGVISPVAHALRMIRQIMLSLYMAKSGNQALAKDVQNRSYIQKTFKIFKAKRLCGNIWTKSDKNQDWAAGWLLCSLLL